MIKSVYPIVETGIVGVVPSLASVLFNTAEFDASFVVVIASVEVIE